MRMLWMFVAATGLGILSSCAHVKSVPEHSGEAGMYLLPWSSDGERDGVMRCMPLSDGFGCFESSSGIMIDVPSYLRIRKEDGTVIESWKPRGGEEILRRLTFPNHRVLVLHRATSTTWREDAPGVSPPDGDLHQIELPRSEKDLPLPERAPRLSPSN